ncbi:hypothetical protein Patl1_28967 [Pistacia atlantica]|uniref:Uncharacterized protein n=1 Tax=Pistacia atlantica TaxID=434234 RepID=A0ACC1BFS3_9ROSI|nr:hypothetical protein Patl1_28967 [Pistacia atlantica]
MANNRNDNASNKLHPSGPTAKDKKRQMKQSRSEAPSMELTLHICSFPRSLYPCNNIIPSQETQFRLARLRRKSSFSCRNSNNSSLLFAEKEQQQLWSGQQQLELDEEEEEEVSEDDASSFLSLNVKPDRNMALLDDYEMEELDYTSDPNHKSGYVAVLGKPNVGKSTLANQMIGQKLSIVTDKPQTTRHRILGICSGPEYQV